MVDVVSKRECVGCKACGDICPVNAITFPEDQEGFWSPAIDLDVCIECDKCESACLVLSRRDRGNKSQPDVLSTINRDEQIRYDSTSGGLYPALASAFLESGGWIIGCAFTPDMQGAEFIASSSRDGLSRIMRSKYFQADTAGIYATTKRLLEQGERVLFSGCPCQVQALYCFLGEEYANLLTVDFICLGINSPLAYRAFISELENEHHSPVKEVRFKDKSAGWTQLGTKIVFQNGEEEFHGKDSDPWVNAYVVGKLMVRPSCTACPCKGFPRVADLSFGDFWGIALSKEDMRKGVSVALINNERGRSLLEESRDMLEVMRYTLEDAVGGNPALVRSVDRGQDAEEFFERIHYEPYSSVVWDLVGRRKRLGLLGRIVSKMRSIADKLR